MKKIAKCIRAFSISALLLAVSGAGALGAFAQDFAADGSYNSATGKWHFLNINGATGSYYQGRALNLYALNANNTGMDQNFVFVDKGNNRWFMCPANNTSFAINRGTGSGKAILWDVTSGADDSYLYQNPSWQGGTLRYEFTLANSAYSGERLSVSSNFANWSDCYFKQITNGWARYWRPINQ